MIGEIMEKIITTFQGNMKVNDESVIRCTMLNLAHHDVSGFHYEQMLQEQQVLTVYIWQMNLVEKTLTENRLVTMSKQE